MIWLWISIMTVWWGTGLVGLVLSVAGLRVALKRRRAIDNGPVLARGLATRLVRAGVTRTVIFTFFLLNAPVVFNMFDVDRDTGINDVVSSTLPFGVIAFAAVVVALSGVVLVFLAVEDLRDMSEGEG
jgi:hypothetical protein